VVKTLRGHTGLLTLRPATLDDAVIVAELDALRDPNDARDPAILRHWWSTMGRIEVAERQIAERDGVPIAFVAAFHARWETTTSRFGAGRIVVHPDHWSAEMQDNLLDVAEDWLKAERCDISVMRMREDFNRELAVLERRGYREVRRAKVWELDLVAGRSRLMVKAEETRAKMRDQGVRMLLLSEDSDPDKMRKLFEVTTESEQDIPTTVPWRVLGFDDWKHHWFANPGVRADRFWIAREGDDIVGMSVLEFPITRNVPWTAFTGTARKVRGRGIARALKYETLAQAIALGFKAVRTQNDGANAPILHLNEEMGYELMSPVLELHRKLGA
jgi:GNAT superfamily N-acetyltransferase